MARELTSDELNLLRGNGQFTKLYLAVLTPNTVYTARLAALPSSTDNVIEISFDSGVGTLSDVKPGMTLYVGTSAGAYDLGVCRLRKDPIAGTFYLGLTSEVRWLSTCHLTVVDDFDLWPKHAVILDSALTMDVDVAYSDQHAAFSPVPILGPHAVAKLEGASVDVQFGPPEGDESWVFDSTIDSVLWEIPDAIAIDDDTAIRPVATFDTVGTHVAYCTVTAGNGKSTTGVRKAYIWDDDHPPATVFQLAQCVGDYETGGWMFDMQMEAEASLSEIRDRSLVILFAEDWYGTPPDQVKQSIGPIAGRENIVCMGRIVGQSIRWDREGGMVHFVVQGAHHWLNRIKGFPIQLQPASVAASWSEMPLMTVDRVLWHLLYWHSTVIETMDFYPSNDTRYVPDGISMASKIWAQLNDMAFSRLLASPGVDRFGRLFVEVDPQAVPEADRDWPVVMALTDDDWRESIDLQRVTVEDVSLIRLTSQVVNESGGAAPLYSLAPGHTPRRYGEPELMDRVLAASQAQSNSIAGLVLGWRINEFPDVPIILLQTNRMFDLWPRQFASLTVAAEDTPRGIAYDGNLIPRRVSLYFEGDSSYMHPEINFEGETFEQLSTDGDIPDVDDDLSLPPIISLPPIDLPPIDLPDGPIVIPGPGESSSGSKRILLHDDETNGSIGLVLTESFDSTSPTWRTVNAGLIADQYASMNILEICPNGAVYAAYSYDGSFATSYCFLARAPYIGGTFVPITLPGTLWAFAINPLASEQYAFIAGDASPANYYVGAGSSYVMGVEIILLSLGPGAISYGFGAWMNTASGVYGVNTPDGQALIRNGTSATTNCHLRASTTGKTFHQHNSADAFQVAVDNFTSISTISTGSGILLKDAPPLIFPPCGDCDPTGMYLMTRGLGSGLRARSTDGGYTWLTIPNLLGGLHWFFRYAGSAQRWVAARGLVYYTQNFGDSWIAKTGNLGSLTVGPSIDMVRVLDY